MDSKRLEKTQNFLNSILKYINECEEEMADVHSDDFYEARKAFKSVALDLIQIGENVNKLLKMENTILENTCEITWQEIVDFRNIAVHSYDGLEEELVLEIVRDDIPALKQAILNLISTHPSTPSKA